MKTPKTQIAIRFTAAQLEVIDQMRRAHPLIPTQTGMIKIIVEKALAEHRKAAKQGG